MNALLTLTRREIAERRPLLWGTLAAAAPPPPGSPPTLAAPGAAPRLARRSGPHLRNHVPDRARHRPRGLRRRRGPRRRGASASTSRGRSAASPSGRARTSPRSSSPWEPGWRSCCPSRCSPAHVHRPSWPTSCASSPIGFFLGSPSSWASSSWPRLSREPTGPGTVCSRSTSSLSPCSCRSAPPWSGGCARPASASSRPGCPRPSTGLVKPAMLVVAAVAAVAAAMQVIVGRTDARRGHLALSTTLWGTLAAGLLLRGRVHLLGPCRHSPGGRRLPMEREHDGFGVPPEFLGGTLPRPRLPTVVPPRYGDGRLRPPPSEPDAGDSPFPGTAAGRSGSRAARASCRCSCCAGSMLPARRPYARASSATPASTRSCRSSATTAGSRFSACRAGSPWWTRTPDARRLRPAWTSSGWTRGAPLLRSRYAFVGDAVVGFFLPASHRPIPRGLDLRLSNRPGDRGAEGRRSRLGANRARRPCARERTQRTPGRRGSLRGASPRARRERCRRGQRDPPRGRSRGGLREATGRSEAASLGSRGARPRSTCPSPQGHRSSRESPEPDGWPWVRVRTIRSPRGPSSSTPRREPWFGWKRA